MRIFFHVRLESRSKSLKTKRTWQICGCHPIDAKTKKRADKRWKRSQKDLRKNTKRYNKLARKTLKRTDKQLRRQMKTWGR